MDETAPNDHARVRVSRDKLISLYRMSRDISLILVINLSRS